MRADMILGKDKSIWRRIDGAAPHALARTFLAVIAAPSRQWRSRQLTNQRFIARRYELMPRTRISASSHHRDLKQSHSMRTNSRRLQSFGDHVLIRC